MSRVTVDTVWRTKFNDLTEPLEVCDETGKTLGHFLPEEAYRGLLYALARAQVSNDEIATLRQQTGGRTLAEIWASLGKS